MKAADNKHSSERALHILHLIYTFEVGGAETMLVDIINGQIERGHSVTLLVVNQGINPDLAAQLDSRVNLVAMNRKQGSAPLLMMLRLNALIARLRPDIIHAHHHKFGRLVRLFRNRLLVTIHALNEPMVYCAGTQMIAITKAVEDNIRERVPAARVTTIYNGIRTADIPSRPEGEAAHKPFRIIQVARLLSKYKGQDILIRAASLLKNQGRDVDITFIGDGTDLQQLLQLAEQEGVADRVHFEGLRSRDYIYSHLSDYDAMVHPSRYEGFGLTIAEAMAAGLPLVLTENDGPWEVADRGRLCLSSKADDAASCADAIVSLIENYPERISIAEQAKEYVKRYDIAKTVDNYLAFYKKLRAK